MNEIGGMCDVEFIDWMNHDEVKLEIDCSCDSKDDYHTTDCLEKAFRPSHVDIGHKKLGIIYFDNKETV